MLASACFKVALKVKQTVREETKMEAAICTCIIDDHNVFNFCIKLDGEIQWLLVKKLKGAC